MPITTSLNHVRYGADAIYYKVKDRIIGLGEAKAHTSTYSFTTVFEDAVNGARSSFSKNQEELNLYLHEDFCIKNLT